VNNLALMKGLDKIRLFRMIHISNVAHILKYGLTLSNSENANKNYIPIGDNSIINVRDNIIVPNGKKLSEFIPFYFGVRMPMLYVVQKGFNSVSNQNPQDIVYCVTNICKINQIKLPFLFTDGHAVNKLSKFFTKKDISVLEKILDFEAIKTKYWKNDNNLDLKRRKEAEFLVAQDIPISVILGWVVYNQKAEDRLLKLGITKDKIAIKENYYF